MEFKGPSTIFCYGRQLSKEMRDNICPGTDRGGWTEIGICEPFL